MTEDEIKSRIDYVRESSKDRAWNKAIAVERMQREAFSKATFKVWLIVAISISVIALVSLFTSEYGGLARESGWIVGGAWMAGFVLFAVFESMPSLPKEMPTED